VKIRAPRHACINFLGLCTPAERTPRIKDQQYCGRKKCQRARKAEWQRTKLKVDPQYKANQDEARAKWRRKNPEFSKQYRDANPDKNFEPAGAAAHCKQEESDFMEKFAFLKPVSRLMSSCVLKNPCVPATPSFPGS